MRTLPEDPPGPLGLGEALWLWSSLLVMMAAVGVLALARGRDRNGAGGRWRGLQTDLDEIRSRLDREPGSGGRRRESEPGAAEGGSG
jgi:hypothetical protein